FTLAICLLSLAIVGSAASKDDAIRSKPDSAVSLPTNFRLQSTPEWWPRKATAIRDEFIGSRECRQCHAAIVASQLRTARAHTASVAAEMEGKLRNETIVAQIGEYHYQISTKDKKSVMNVGHDASSFSVPLPWTFGVGRRGQTSIYEKDGIFYESRVSY